MSLDNIVLVLECMWAGKPLLEWVDYKKTVTAKRPTSSLVEVFRLSLPRGQTALASTQVITEWKEEHEFLWPVLLSKYN